jgi:hypothetical protein
MVAVAALQPRFPAALERGVGATADAMAAAFGRETAAHWETRGRELDIPLVAVRASGDGRE